MEDAEHTGAFANLLFSGFPADLSNPHLPFTTVGNMQYFISWIS